MHCSYSYMSMFMYGKKSMNRWTSTDIRLTISPTVRSFFAVLESRNAFLWSARILKWKMSFRDDKT